MGCGKENIPKRFQKKHQRQIRSKPLKLGQMQFNIWIGTLNSEQRHFLFLYPFVFSTLAHRKDKFVSVAPPI